MWNNIFEYILTTLFSSHLYSTEFMPNTTLSDIAVTQLQSSRTLCVMEDVHGPSCTQIIQMLNLTLCASDILFFSEIMCSLRIVFNLLKSSLHVPHT